MNQTIHKFDTFEELKAKFDELIAEGIDKERINLYSPNPNHHFDELMGGKPSWVRAWTLIGGVSGCLGGFLMTAWMSGLSWPIQTGNKGFITMPPFMVIMFELTILLGALFTLAGFMFLARVPDPVKIIFPEDFENYFAIVIDEGDKSE